MEADLTCTCQRSHCVHLALLAGVRDRWDPFAPREVTEGRHHFNNVRAVESALTDLVAAPPLDDPPDALARLRRVLDHPSDPRNYRGRALVRWSAHRMSLARAVGGPVLAAAHAPETIARGLGDELGRCLGGGDYGGACRLLSLWHEWLRACGVEGSLLPESPLLCGGCGRVCDPSGVCPTCLPATLDDAAGRTPASQPGYLAGVLATTGGTRAEVLLRAAASRVNEAAVQGDRQAWSGATRDWNYLALGTGLELPEEPPICPRCERILQASGACPSPDCARDEPAGEPVALGRAALIQAHAEAPLGLEPGDLRAVEFEADARGLTGVVLGFDQNEVRLDYHHGRWTFADPDELAALRRGAEATPDDDLRTEVTLRAVAAKVALALGLR